MSIDTAYLAQLYQTAGTAVPAPPAQAVAPPRMPDTLQLSQERVLQLPVSKLVDFPRSRSNRYEIHKGEKMEELVENIRHNGILQPLVVRPWEGGTYQIVSGRNRREAARILGYETVPCLVRDLSDQEALRQLNYINSRTREGLRPSEKAYAYALEYDQSNSQGFRSDLTLFQSETKLEEEQDGRTTKWRYRRLTNLVADGYLDAVDDGLIGMGAAVLLADLSPNDQETVYHFFFEEWPEEDGLCVSYREEGVTITPTLAERMKELTEGGTPIRPESIEQLLLGPEQQAEENYPSLKLSMRPLRKRYPQLKGLGTKAVEQIIDQALELYFSS